MADISAKTVMELRKRTGVGMMDCKKALSEVGGDIDEAIKHLRKQGAAKAEKKSGRAVGEGRIAHYIHAGDKIGVMVELNCETDFVARNSDFVELGRDIAMHVAAANPLFVSREEVDQPALDAEREIHTERALKEGKPEKIVAKIVDGRMAKYYAENCLLEQAFVKDPDRTIESLIQGMVQKLGENIQVTRFNRFAVGEE
jgi:elongation factor Ts